MKRLFFISNMMLSTSSIIMLYKGNYMHIAIMIIALLSFLAYSDECRDKECMWMFVLVAIASFPVNIALIIKANALLEFMIIGTVTRVITLAFIYSVLFSAEELLLGLTARIIWMKQDDDE